MRLTRFGKVKLKAIAIQYKHKSHTIIMLRWINTNPIHCVIIFDIDLKYPVIRNIAKQLIDRDKAGPWAFPT